MRIIDAFPWGSKLLVHVDAVQNSAVGLGLISTVVRVHMNSRSLSKGLAKRKLPSADVGKSSGIKTPEGDLPYSHVSRCEELVLKCIRNRGLEERRCELSPLDRDGSRAIVLHH